MDFVTSWLAIGALSDALDTDSLRACRISAVLSLMPVELHGAVSHYRVLQVEDRLALPPGAIAGAVEFIRHHVNDGRRVLLHCEQGISRSPSIGACYLHECCGLSLDEAMAHVKRVRPCSDPHPALIASIREYYGRRRKGPVRDPFPVPHRGAVFP